MHTYLKNLLDYPSSWIQHCCQKTRPDLKKKYPQVIATMPTSPVTLLFKHRALQTSDSEQPKKTTGFRHFCFLCFHVSGIFGFGCFASDIFFCCLPSISFSIFFLCGIVRWFQFSKYFHQTPQKITTKTRVLGEIKYIVYLFFCVLQFSSWSVENRFKPPPTEVGSSRLLLIGI